MGPKPTLKVELKLLKAGASTRTRHYQSPSENGPALIGVYRVFGVLRSSPTMPELPESSLGSPGRRDDDSSGANLAPGRRDCRARSDARDFELSLTGAPILLVGANQRITNFCRRCQPGGLMKGM